MERSANLLVRMRRTPHFVGCKEDHQCPTGFFCEVAQLSCRACLSCEELNRQTGQENVTCVTSATACGACFAGMLPGQADSKCFSPSDGQLLLPYEWAVIAIGLLLAVLICLAAVYVLRNFSTFKIRASTRTAVLSPVDVEASAPQLPPSYNDVAASPSAIQLRNDDESAPFIKPIPTPPAREAREAAARQCARVFNNPSYIRNVQPPSYEIPNAQETLPTIQESDTNVINENSASSENVSVGEESSGGVVQDTNNNRGGGDKGDCTIPHSGTFFIINVMKNVDTVQQRNEMII